MKKMSYGTFACEVSVNEKFSFCSQVECEYDKETVGYAAKKFFIHSKKLCRECTHESWLIRVSKAKNQKRRYMEYIIPAALMELPGNWACISGSIDDKGVCINSIKLLDEHPCFTRIS